MNNTQKSDVDLTQILHYGAVVALTPSTEESNGSFLFCDGFILTNLILQNFTNKSEDFQGALFRIVPSYVSEMQNKIVEEINHENKLSRKTNFNYSENCFRKTFFYSVCQNNF